MGGVRSAPVPGACQQPWGPLASPRAQTQSPQPVPGGCRRDQRLSTSPRQTGWGCSALAGSPYDAVAFPASVSPTPGLRSQTWSSVHFAGQEASTTPEQGGWSRSDAPCKPGLCMGLCLPGLGVFLLLTFSSRTWRGTRLNTSHPAQEKRGTE